MPSARELAIAALRPGAEWVLDDDELVWLDQVQTEPTEQEITDEIASQAAAVAAAAQEQQLRRQERVAGLTLEEMVHALWRKVMENDSTRADDLQDVRDDIRQEP